MKRFIWKTIKISDPNAIARLESTYGSSCKAMGENKTFCINKWPGGGEVETNITWRNLHDLFRFANVRIPWKNGVLYDDKPSWEEKDI